MEEYIRRAEAAADQASREERPEVKLALLEIAATWTKLAEATLAAAHRGADDEAAPDRA